MDNVHPYYFYDAVIGLGFVTTAISALVSMVPLDWIHFSNTATPAVLGINVGV